MNLLASNPVLLTVFYLVGAPGQNAKDLVWVLGPVSNLIIFEVFEVVFMRNRFILADRNKNLGNVHKGRPIFGYLGISIKMGRFKTGYLQGQPMLGVQSNLALTDSIVQIKSGLKVVLEC